MHIVLQSFFDTHVFESSGSVYTLNTAERIDLKKKYFDFKSIENFDESRLKNKLLDIFQNNEVVNKILRIILTIYDNYKVHSEDVFFSIYNDREVVPNGDLRPKFYNSLKIEDYYATAVV